MLVAFNLPSPVPDVKMKTFAILSAYQLEAAPGADFLGGWQIGRIAQRLILCSRNR